MIQHSCHINRLILLIAMVVCCRILCASAVDAAANDFQKNGERNDLSAQQPRDGLAESAPALPVYLYFEDRNSPYLMGEERSGLHSDDPTIFCRQIVDALISGPASNLVRTIPSEATLRAIFLDNKTAYVDLSREVAVSHPGGIVSELMTVYSIVNTLVLNVDAVDKVKILIAGMDAETLSGHIDIRFPLKADILLIR